MSTVRAPHASASKSATSLALQDLRARTFCQAAAHASTAFAMPATRWPAPDAADIVDH
eukprot:CAMPEP_0202880360 /NCGR_PEP_ID=MMETSP1391-20130828/34979_1 /ASSEMBLY_ACC=CAM_ASM_000867 /TAXON_ID=1034604 /ORGANISM="Chlamydomonas leiostraca, Strain SAG 11-49" /LENGTH=57 /DNA_ID=CAMNT_0049562857 /DNA_START=768 /DNA_END=941 /DNA_ORIENTATION=+